MKVLQINAVYGFGSTGIIVKDIQNTLIKNGHESYVAYQNAIGDVHNGYKIGNKLDWKLHALHSRIFGKQGYASKRATKRFLKWVDKIKPDIVHLHNLHSNYINFNILCDYLAKNDIATVITLHDCWYFTGKCTHFVKVNCNKWQTCCEKCPQLKNEVPSWFKDNTSKVFKDRIAHLNKIPNLTIVGCSNWITELSKKSLLQAKNYQTIYNGVDIKIFTPHNNSFISDYNLHDKFLILVMANKWFDPLNETFTQEFLARLNKNYKLIVVGCNSTKEQLLKKYDNVLPLGYIKDRQLLSDVYSSCNVFLNITYADTLPTVNMESICCGTKVVTFDSCGCKELILPNTGYVVEQGDVEQTINAIKMVENENKISNEVLEIAREKYNKDYCYNNYILLYENINNKE